MKIKITYQEECELEEALRIPIVQLIKRGGKLRKSRRHPPYYHAYITIRNINKPPNEAENT